MFRAKKQKKEKGEKKGTYTYVSINEQNVRRIKIDKRINDILVPATGGSVYFVRKTY